MIDMRKELKKRSKLFLILLCMSALTAVLSGCFSPLIPNDKGNLLIFLGVPDLSRKTYTPYVDLSMFEEISIRVVKFETTEETIEEIIDEETIVTVVEVVNEIVFAEISRNPQYQSTTIELIDLPYDTYTITAHAYLTVLDKDEENCTAYGEVEFEFSERTPWATVVLDPFIGIEDTKGTLKYKLINAIGLPVTAELYPYDDISPASRMILTQGTNPLDPAAGFYTISLDSGFYMFFFGENPPCVVQIFKNLETLLEDEFSIFGSLTTAVNPGGSSDVQILLSHNGTPIEEGEILSYGTEITVSIIRGNDYRYVKDSVKLNNGNDDNWFLVPEESISNESIFTRTFRMPARDVLVSIQTELIPKVNIDFSDPNLSKYLKFRNAMDNAEIDYAYPGQQITVVFDHPAGSGALAVQSWWLDSVTASSDDPAKLIFTVPNPCLAWNVTVMVTIGNVPHSVSIPIWH